ncbi:hypothetical protein HYH03_006775 [Edaphochlamys debaryana]|uniref:Uncharacterized protein n=1 Tax=Edaphochlamys debaryana TaxID=47281 RepID=A0A835Y3D6_9CHLO|nr:hypothetical protein HYH03_006775 [Edaphochlamys debaryana]|eukprot:KAG2495168.1 hypothetical protein HYH03_006775 [Edaphochlamys debaryana]
MVGLTKKGKVISAKSDSGVKTLRQLEPGVDTPACTAVSAGAWHVLGITEGGGLVAWAVSDCEEAKASVAPFIPIPVGAMPIVHMGGGALASAATVAVGAPRRWSFAGASHGRMRVTHASAGTVHSLLALSDGSVYVAGIKASQRFSRNMGISTLYIKDVQQIKLPVRSKQVLHAEACGSDLCCVVTDGGVVCWADEQKAYSSTDRSWSAEYAPVPRHVKELDKVAIKQIAVSDAYAMCAALAADGRIFLWCIKLSEKSWPAAWLNPQVAAVAPGAISIGWSCKDLYVCMPGGSTPADIKLCAARPEQ